MFPQTIMRVKGNRGALCQLFSGNPSTCPMFFTGLKTSCTSARSCGSSGSSIHLAQLRMLSGLALPAMVVVMSALTDMNLPASVRIPLRLHQPAMLTPLEAAVVSERAYMIRLVHDRGARLDPQELRTLRCIAQARKDRGTIAYLAELDSSPLNCEGVAIPY